MDTTKAWKIVKNGTCKSKFTEDEAILYEEALYYILTEALELTEKSDFYLWRTDVEAGAYNLAAYYEKIGKFDLALKYYSMSEQYGCSFAGKDIERVKNLI